MEWIYEFAEGARGILITACRRCRLLDHRPSARVEPKIFQQQGHEPLEALWLAWIETEKRKRLGLSIYVGDDPPLVNTVANFLKIFDCQYPSLFNNQPYVSKAETTNCLFPCDEKYWSSPCAQSWSNLVAPSNEPETACYLHALNCCLLRKYIKPPPPIAQTNEFGKTILIYALHTHIFEWRQVSPPLS